MNKSKWLSILLALCMIIGMVPFSFSAVADEASAVEYYVMYGGSGDGLTRENPMGSLKSAIDAIESSGAGAGTVYVIDAEDAFTATVGENGVAHHFVSWQYVTHNATVTVKGADGMANSHLALSPKWGDNNEAYLGGPVVFEDITLFRTRSADNGVNANGYDLTIGENVNFQKTGADLASASNKWDGNLYDTELTVKPGANYPSSDLVKGAGGVIVISSNTAEQKTRVDLPAWADGRTYSADTTLYVNKADSGVYFNVGGKNKGGTAAVYSKNLNFVFGDIPSAQIAKANGGNITDVVKVKGALQVIAPESVEYSNTAADALTAEGGTWTMRTESADMLDVTETAGTFAVNNGTVYAYNGGNKIYYNTDSTLSVASGTWNVTASKETATATLADGWVDDGKGTITAESVTDYYVMYGGTGDGRSEENPMGSIASAITAIENSGAGAGTIYVLDADDAFTATVGENKVEHHFVSWQNVSHTAVITVKGAKGKDNSHLAISSKWGDNSEAYIGGPTVFEDITIIRLRYYDKTINSNGFDLTIGENVAFAGPKTDLVSDSNKWDGTLVNMGFRLMPGANYPPSGLVQGQGGTLTVNSDTAGSATAIDLPAWSDGRTYANDINIYVNKADSGVKFAVGGKYKSGNAAVFSKNLNLVLGSIGSTTIVKAGSDITDKLTVKGALQIIAPASVTVTNSAGDFLTAEGGTWTMTTEAAGVLDVTEKAGTFTVADGTVYAYGAGDVVYYNVKDELTVPAGTWNVTADKATAVAKLGDDWKDNGDGTITVIRPDVVYVSNKYGSDDNDGLSADKPFKTLAAAVTAIGLDKDGTVKILDGKDADGNAEYAVYTRNNPWPGTYGPDSVSDGASIQDVLTYSGSTVIPKHTGTITYEGLNTDCVICFGANHLELRGPSVFKNLSLIEGWSYGKQIITFGYALTLDNVKYIRTSISNASDAATREANGALVYSDSNKLDIDISGRNAVTDKGTLVIGAGAPKIGEIGLGGWDRDVTISADQKVVIEEGASVTSVKILNNNGSWKMQTLSVVLNEKVSKLYNRSSSTSGSSTVTAVQIIENNGVDVDYDRTLGVGSATIGGVWFVKAAEGVYLDTTDTNGTFSSDTTVYAYQPNGSTIYYGTSLALPAGDWFVAASADAAKEGNGTPTSSVSQKVFDKWVDNGAGKIEAVFKLDVAVVPGVYYVMFEGTGDGKTPDDPMGSTSTAIAAIEADDTVTEGTVYILNNPAYAGNYLPEKSKTHNYASWAKPAAHTKLIHVVGFDADSSTVLMHSPKCDTGDMQFNGPIAFSNITLARTRNCDEGLTSGGWDITLDDTTLIKHFSKDSYNNNGWFITPGTTLVSAYNSNFVKFGSGRAAASAQGGRLDISAKENVRVEFDWQGGTYTNDATLAIASSGKDVTLYMSKNEGKNTTYKKNLNFVFGNVGGVTINVGKATTTIEGDFQLIYPTGVTAALPGTIALQGKTYDIETETAGMLDVTETSGVYRVLTDDVLVATDKNNSALVYPSSSGYLTVPAGSYTVKKITDASKITTLTFDGDYMVLKGLKGAKVKLPDHASTILYEFKGWSLDGVDVYPAGYEFEIMEDDEDELNFTSVWDAYEDTAMVFVDAENGSDEKSGANAEDAFATIEKGFAALNAASEGTKKLILIGYYAYTNALPENTSPIIIMGDGTGKSVLDLNTHYIYAKGPIVFENIALGQTSTLGGKHFDTQGNSLTIGENVTAYNGTYMSLRFGMDNGNMTQKPILIKSGKWNSIDLGPYYNNNLTRHTLTDSDIVIEGGTIGKINLTADHYMDSQTGSNYAGHIRFTVNGGSLGSVVFATVASSGENFASKFTDDAVFQLLNNNGTKTSISGISENCNNVWAVAADKVDGCSLEYTETDGVYKVNGEKTAIGYQNGKAVAVSSGGFITIPKGSTEVKFVDKIEYLYVDDTITFYEDVTDFDVSAVEPSMKDGKVFIGWKKGDAAASKVADYVVGDTLTAQYVDIDTTDETGEFFIVGAQIRKGSANVEQGLRFVIEKKDTVAEKLPEVVEFGSLILPTDLTRGHDMKYGQPLYNEYQKALPSNVNVTTWTSGSWSSSQGPSAVPANVLFKDVDGGVWYTVCVTGIDETKYDRFYTVKGYIRYNDLNGVERVAYTEYYQTSLAKVAEAAIAAGETDASITGVVDYYENGRKAAYMAENYDNRTDLKTVKADGTLYSWQETEGSANIPGVTNKDFYQLKNGLKIREVEFDLSNGADRKPVEIVQVGDTHLNYVNDKDWQEQSTCILATYKGRAWNRNGSSVSTINRFMEYVSFFDQTVVTGDILDYFSWGCAEMVQKLIVDKDPDILFAIGNHEPAIHMQNVEHVCNTDSSLDAVHERLSTFWPNDTKYDSKIIKNEDGIEMAMLVVMDNEAHKYLWEEIYEGLKRDIEIAREKNIPILMFQHCPISTRGGAEEDRYSWFYKNGDTSGFDSNKTVDLGKHEAGSTSSELDKRVYSLIVDNADVVRGLFCGDYHNFMYTEIKGTDGTMIPQYVSTANAYENGCAVKITIK